MSQFSRRQVIGGAGSAMLVGGTGAAKAAPNTTSNLTADVCIVGAGFAGLAGGAAAEAGGRQRGGAGSARPGRRALVDRHHEGRRLGRLGRPVGRLVAGALLCADQGDGLRDLSVAEFRQDAPAQHLRHQRVLPHRRGRGRSLPGLRCPQGHLQAARRHRRHRRRERAVGASRRQAARFGDLCRMAAAERAARRRPAIRRHRGRVGAVREPGGNLRAASRLADQGVPRHRRAVRRRAGRPPDRRHAAGRAARRRAAQGRDQAQPAGAPHPVERQGRGGAVRQHRGDGAARHRLRAAEPRRRHRVCAARCRPTACR